MNKSSVWTDSIGVVASIACAIHCAAMPFVVGFLPSMGLSFLADESFHKIMVGVCSLIAAIAFIPGLRLHGRLLPFIVATAGLGMISIAAFGLEGECCTSCELTTPLASTEVQVGAEACCEHCVAESGQPITANEQSETANEQPKLAATPILSSFFPWITPLGGLLLVTAHLTNRRLSCICGCCTSE